MHENSCFSSAPFPLKQQQATKSSSLVNLNSEHVNTCTDLSLNWRPQSSKSETVALGVFFNHVYPCKAVRSWCLICGFFVPLVLAGRAGTCCRSWWGAVVGLELELEHRDVLTHFCLPSHWDGAQLPWAAWTCLPRGMGNEFVALLSGFVLPIELIFSYFFHFYPSGSLPHPPGDRVGEQPSGALAAGWGQTTALLKVLF